MTIESAASRPGAEPTAAKRARRGKAVAMDGSLSREPSRGVGFRVAGTYRRNLAP